MSESINHELTALEHVLEREYPSLFTLTPAVVAGGKKLGQYEVKPSENGNAVEINLGGVWKPLKPHTLACYLILQNPERSMIFRFVKAMDDSLPGLYREFYSQLAARSKEIDSSLEAIPS